MSFSKKSVKPDGKLKKRLASLRGKPLTDKAVVDLLVDIAHHFPYGVAGLGIRLRRDGDDTGVQMTLTLLPPNDPLPGEGFFSAFMSRCRSTGKG